jgi:hypothetical protein
MTPHHQYFATNHGRWGCTFDFRVTDWSAFWATPMSWTDRLQVVSMALVPRVIGALRFETEVVHDPASEVVVHRTWVRKWGLALLDSEEQFTLLDDGRSMAISGVRRTAPTWIAETFGATFAEVAESGSEASYRFPWFGTEIVQTTRNVRGGGCDITQRTPFSEGLQRLRAR